jgi:hypothetical protein
MRFICLKVIHINKILKIQCWVVLNLHATSLGGAPPSDHGGDVPGCN